MMVNLMKTLELHYPMFQFLIMIIYLFRKNCNFCKCPLECHDIPLNTNYNNLPEDRIGVEEKPQRSSLTKVKEAHAEGFEWVPAGLTSEQVCETSLILYGCQRTHMQLIKCSYYYNGFHSNI